MRTLRTFASISLAIWVSVHSQGFEWTGELKSLTSKYCRITVHAFPEAGEAGIIEKAFKMGEWDAIYSNADSTAAPVRYIVK